MARKPKPTQRNHFKIFLDRVGLREAGWSGWRGSGVTNEQCSISGRQCFLLGHELKIQECPVICRTSECSQLHPINKGMGQRGDSPENSEDGFPITHVVNDPIFALSSSHVVSGDSYKARYNKDELGCRSIIRHAGFCHANIGINKALPNLVMRVLFPLRR